VPRRASGAKVLQPRELSATAGADDELAVASGGAPPAVTARHDAGATRRRRPGELRKAEATLESWLSVGATRRPARLR